MTTIVKVSTKKSGSIRVLTRVIFLIIGFSLIFMALTNPPIKTLWAGLGNILGIFLILYSMVGLTPRLRISAFGKLIHNSGFHIAATFSIGIAIIIAAMINPPVASIWYAYFNLIGLLLIFDAVITSTIEAKKAKKKLSEKVEAPV